MLTMSKKTEEGGNIITKEEASVKTFGLPSDVDSIHEEEDGEEVDASAGFQEEGHTKAAFKEKEKYDPEKLQCGLD